jgi:large subunit ribosomal protein L17
MHRHGYIGRKLGLERDQRRSLLKGLATSLVEHGKIETTLPKAKELIRYIEKLITKEKKGDLANRRRVIAGLATLESAHKLVDEIAPKLSARNSGHVRIKRTNLRVGDGTQMATIEFVDDLTKAPVKSTELKVELKPKTVAKATKKVAPTAKKPVAKGKK